MKKSLFVLILVLCSVLPISGKEGMITHSYRTLQGLPSNNVSCLIQDSDGFVWMGTDNGLCRFDGLNKQVFNSSNQGFHHIGEDYVYSLMEDDSGCIWAGTKNGVFICEDGLNFHQFTHKTKYGVLPSCEVTSLLQLKSGEIWMGTLGQGLFIYNPVTGILRQDNKHVNFVYEICTIDNAVFVASMAEGVAHYNVNGYFVDYVHMADGSPLYDNISCMTVCDQTVWLGSARSKVYRMDPYGEVCDCVDVSNAGFRVIKSLYAESGAQDVLIGTDSGLYHLPKDSFRVDAVFRDPLQDFVDAEVECAIKDSEGGRWFATENKGVIYVSKRQKPYLSITDVRLKMVNGFCEDNHTGRIWIAARNGLFYKDAGNDTVYQHPGLKETEVRALCIYDDCLWIGTYGQGLKALDLKSGRMETYVANRMIPNSLCSNYVTALCTRKDGEICIGTKWGYCYLRPGRNEFLTFTSLSYTLSITGVLEDQSGNLWMSTSHSGLYVMYRGAIDFVRYEENNPADGHCPPSVNVACVSAGKDGRTYFGTYGNGIYCFDPQTNTFSSMYDGDSWLSERTVYSMAYDNNGFLCLATDAGFVHIPENASMNYQVMTFDDGLAGDQFNNGAALLSKDGLIYFGETNGMDVLDPADIVNNVYVPQVYISKIRLTDADSEDESSNILDFKTAVYKTKEIKLPYYRNSLSFTFSSLSYQYPQKNRFSYKMDGVDQNWVSDLESNEVIYRNLSPGKYTLRVKASNNDNVWNEKEVSLSIHITPPWWKSTYANAAYILLVLLSIAAGVWLYRERTKKKYLSLVEHFNEKKEKDIYQSKIRFFTQIVHEIRTPLTLIKLPVEVLKERLGPDNKECQAVDRNVNYLLGVVNELLDMQKIENGDMSLQTIRADFSECVRDCCEQFAEAFLSKEIKFPVNLPQKPVETLFDPVKMSKLLVNLLGNAFKYAKSEVRVNLHEASGTIVLRIEDDGPGIKEENREKIFQAFFQEQNDKTSLGTGLGLTYARQIAQCHQGDLKIVDTDLGGAAFELTIPHLTEHGISQGLKEESDLLESIVPAPDSSKYSILLVEDNEELLDTVAAQLEKWYTVIKAANGLEALGCLSNRNIDVIVSDVMMPVMDGLELCQKVKSDMSFSHIPIILLTAKIQLQAKLEGMQAGADVYMEKPFTIGQLHMQVENLFRLRESFHSWVNSLLTSPERILVNYRQSDSGAAPRNREFIFKMNGIIDQHLGQEDFDLESFSKELGLSKSSFYRKLHTLSDMTPSEYLKNYRLGKAAEMLTQGKRASEVFFEVGFSTASYFSKCFKQKYGVLPKDYQTNKETS